jgi:hypothetical protein
MTLPFPPAPEHQLPLGSSVTAVDELGRPLDAAHLAYAQALELQAMSGCAIHDGLAAYPPNLGYEQPLYEATPEAELEMCLANAGLSYLLKPLLEQVSRHMCL